MATNIQHALDIHGCVPLEPQGLGLAVHKDSYLSVLRLRVSELFSCTGGNNSISDDVLCASRSKQYQEWTDGENSPSLCPTISSVMVTS